MSLAEPVSATRAAMFLDELPTRTVAPLVLRRKQFSASPYDFVLTVSRALAAMSAGKINELPVQLSTGDVVELRSTIANVEISMLGETVSAPHAVLLDELTKLWATAEQAALKLATTPFERALVAADGAELSALRSKPSEAPLQGKDALDTYQKLTGQTFPLTKLQPATSGTPAQRLALELGLVAASESEIFFFSFFDSRLRLSFGSKERTVLFEDFARPFVHPRVELVTKFAEAFKGSFTYAYGELY